MATDLLTVTGRDLIKLIEDLAAAGFTSDMLRAVIRHADMPKLMVEALKEHAHFRLIHGVFNRQEVVLENFRMRCITEKIDLDRFQWDSPLAAPHFDPNDQEIAVGLNATLSGLQETFEFSWKWLIEGHSEHYRFPGLSSDPDKLALLEGQEFMPWRLKWVRAKLDTHLNVAPADVENPATSPGCALLLLMAQHPERIRKIDYKSRNGFWLTGLRCTGPEEEAYPLMRVPNVAYYAGTRSVELQSEHRTKPRSYLSCPTIVP